MPSAPVSRRRASRPLGYAALLTSVLAAVGGCSGGPAGGTTGPTATTSPATSTPASPSSSPTEPTTTAPNCPQATFEALTPEQRLGQLVMVALDTNAGVGGVDSLVSEHHVGNVIFLGGFDGAAKVAAASTHLTRQVRTESTGEIGLLLAADQEGGEVQQLRGDGFTRIPSAATQSGMSSAALTAQAATWAKEMVRVGVNVNLAPVTDTVPASIGRNNAPIGRWNREYADNPAEVTKASTAFIAGMLAGGVEPTVKHFPGLGRIRSNTDFSSTGITDSVTTVADPFLAPFAAGVKAGAGLVMVSSARYPQLDAKNQAMFSSAIITDLLRGRLGYSGVVITDDMNAVSVRGIPAAERAVRYLRAGGDIALTGRPADVPAMIAAWRAAAKAEPAFAATVDASVARVLALKDRMGLLPCSIRR